MKLLGRAGVRYLYICKLGKTIEFESNSAVKKNKVYMLKSVRGRGMFRVLESMGHGWF